MHHTELFVAPTEFKFLDGEPGVFEGYGAVFNKVDSHKDVILPGAFAATLAEHKKNGTLPGLYAEHSAFMGGDPLPVGAWTEMAEDEHGLKVKGKISALDSDHGKRIRGLMQDGALRGLSIAYQVPPGGARMGKKQGEPRRTLVAVNLTAVDIVRDPSNSEARIESLKSAFAQHLKDAGGADDAELEEDDTDVATAIESIGAAIVMQDKVMSGYGYGSGSSKDSALMMDRLRDAYFSLTGERVPDGLTGWTKSAPATLRETQAILREELGLSNARASAIAKRLVGSLPRDEGSTKAAPADANGALRELGASLSGFSLSTP